MRRRRAIKVMGPDGWMYPEGTTFSDTPRKPGEIATDENLALAALDNQARIERDEADPFAITADKLATKLPGMMAGPAQLDDPTYAFKFREEDEQLLKVEQARNKGVIVRQQITSQHFEDDEGNPAGGSTSGRGISISWQNGPLQRSEGDTRDEPNGAFVEGVIEAAKDRLEYYQGSKFACEENAQAIQYLEAALTMLDLRTANRTLRGVEGTHEV